MPDLLGNLGEVLAHPLDDGLEVGFGDDDVLFLNSLSLVFGQIKSRSVLEAEGIVQRLALGDDR